MAWQASLIFLAVGLTLLAGYIQYNAKIAYQPQARYFFIVLLPGAIALTGGIYLFAARSILRAAAFALLFMRLVVLNGLGLVTVDKAGVASGGIRQGLRS